MKDRAMRCLPFTPVVAVTLVLFGYAARGDAAQSTTTFSVSATVNASCSLSATNLAFGTVNVVSGTPVDATSTITATCANGVAYTIGLNAGTGSGATVTTRKMTSGANTLNYELFTDSNRTAHWTDIAGANVASGTGTGAGQTYTVYGTVSGGQEGTPTGSYNDTITATIDF